MRRKKNGCGSRAMQLSRDGYILREHRISPNTCRCKWNSRRCAAPEEAAAARRVVQFRSSISYIIDAILQISISGTRIGSSLDFSAMIKYSGIRDDLRWWQRWDASRCSGRNKFCVSGFMETAAPIVFSGVLKFIPGFILISVLLFADVFFVFFLGIT